MNQAETEPKIAIIILNWNGYHDTIKCLESVLKLRYSNFQIILLDNGSTDGSVEIIVNWAGEKRRSSGTRIESSGRLPDISVLDINKYDEISDLDARIIILRSNKNLGYGEGGNKALEFALKKLNSIDYFFFLNNDTYLDADSLKYAVIVMQEKNAAIVGFLVKDIHGKIVFSKDTRTPELFYTTNRFPQISLERDEISTTAHGCANLIKKEMILKHKENKGYLFNKKLFIYGEDTEFYLNVYKMGGRIYMAKEAFVYHKESQSITSERKEAIKIYYTTRNCIFIANSVFKGFWLAFFHFFYPLIRIKAAAQKIAYNNLKEAKAILWGLYDGYCGKGGRWKRKL